MFLFKSKNKTKQVQEQEKQQSNSRIVEQSKKEEKLKNASPISLRRIFSFKERGASPNKKELVRQQQAAKVGAGKLFIR